MNNCSRWIRGSVLICLIAPTVHGGDEASPYCTKEGRLKHALHMEDLRPGQGGLTGLVWTIAPSGKWRVVAFAKGKPAEKPLRTGKLSRDQMAALANHLAAQDLMHLPRNFGVRRPVVPHLLALRFGKTSTTLDCGTWDDLTEVAPPPRDPQAAAWSRLIALAFVIEKMTRHAKAPAQDKKI